jgi:RimJ/RimL family protein N-acetyltransferase
MGGFRLSSDRIISREERGSMIPPTLRSHRLELKALDPAALGPDYAAWLNDPVINRYLEVRFEVQTPESIARFVRAMNASADNYLFGIFSDQKHIGNIKLGPIDRHHRRGEIGLLIGDRSSWGRGIGREAIGLVTDFAFETLNLHKVTAGCYAENEASHRAFLRAGWSDSGRYVEHALLDGRWCDMLRFEKVNTSD